MALNRFSNLEETITKRDFLIEFKELKIDHIDDLYTYKQTFNKSMKEFRFSITMMFIGVIPGLLFLIIPGVVLLYFAKKLHNRAKDSAHALDLAIEEYTIELENNQST